MNIDQYQTLSDGLELTELDGLSVAIDEAFEAGAKREPKTFNLVVHPTFPFIEEYQQLTQTVAGKKGIPPKTITELNWNYAKKIKALLSTAENIIVLPSGGDDKDAWSEQFETIAGTDPASGYLPPEGLKEFLKKTEGVHPEDTFIIHGSSFGYCTEQTAIQLLGLQAFRVAINSGHIVEFYVDRRRRKTRHSTNHMENLARSFHSEIKANVTLGIQHNTSILDPSDNIFVGPNTHIIPNPNADELS